MFPVPLHAGWYAGGGGEVNFMNRVVVPFLALLILIEVPCIASADGCPAAVSEVLYTPALVLLSYTDPQHTNERLCCCFDNDIYLDYQICISTEPGVCCGKDKPGAVTYTYELKYAAHPIAREGVWNQFDNGSPVYEDLAIYWILVICSFDDGERKCSFTVDPDNTGVLYDFVCEPCD